MKLLANITLSLVAIYIALWMAVAAYFSFADRHEEILESNLSSLFERPVSIDSVRTTWIGLSPSFEIIGLNVAGDTAQHSALSFKKVSAILDPVSILFFWPSFTQFAIEQPEVEIVNLDNGLLQIAGIQLNSNQSKGFNLRRLISWLLDHHSVTWHDGSIVWRKSFDNVDYFNDISFLYERQQQARSMIATIKLPQGALAFKSQSNGDVINSSDWDYSLEILGEQGKRYLASDDLSLNVSGGKGQLKLKSLDIEVIRDFLQLTGIGGTQSWVLNSELSGQLSNAQFNFSGPLLDFNDWSLTAQATGVACKSTDNMPAMNNLNGSIEASSKGGVFHFETQSAEFSWDRWFAQPFPITQASGSFSWDLSQSEKIQVKLSDGIFRDQITNIRNMNAVAEIATGKTRISNFADLFKGASIKDLSFSAGEVVNRSADTAFSGSITLDASADFDVPNLFLLENYFPQDPRISLFREWWKNAVLTGAASDGSIRYQGSVTKDALYDGSAQLTGRANYHDVELDYGYERDWPLLLKAKGIVQVENSTLEFLSDEAWVAQDQVDKAKVTISSIFRKDRALDIDASMQSSLPTVMDFLFDGPLIPKQSTEPKQALPITSDGGLVSADVVVNIPLSDVTLTKVTGRASLKDGQLMLPENVPVSNISGFVEFTEKSAESNNIEGQFLGGLVTAKVNTIEAAQPPVLQVTAQGIADVVELRPWVGDHVLSWMKGKTDWQGTILVDGPQAQILASSNLGGVNVTAPAPLKKLAITQQPLALEMTVGQNVEQSLSINIGDHLFAKFLGDKTKNNNLLDKSIISLGGNRTVKNGINFDINYDEIDLDAWLEAIIELSQIKIEGIDSGTTDTAFLDSMRSVKVLAKDPTLLGRKFGSIELSAVSSDGGNWVGSIIGDNIDGIIQAQPRDEIAVYRFNLSKLYISEGPKEKPPLNPIDNTLLPGNYPIIDINVNSFRFVRKQLGHLQMRGEPVDGAWKLINFELEHQGVNTTAQGEWANTPETGTITSFDIQTTIDEAGGALQELDMGGIVSKGDGSLTANLNWIGAPHEFDFSRLNGEFDLRVQDGELVKIEPGTGKLLGLLNFNAIARRLTLDFSDVISSGLEFDRMRYSGVFADGEAIMREAYIFTPSVFVNMEGKLDLDKELIDMEIHLSPELGGNLTLLSALANPAAGAIVFLTQQLFKEEMRSASYKSYRALGTWEDFEMVEFDVNDE